MYGQVLREGAEAANESASRTLFNVRQAMGFTPQPETLAS